jgi:hypothetical protein
MFVLGKADEMAIRDSRTSMAATRPMSLEIQNYKALQHIITSTVDS